jgi:hypothetical protein
MVSNRDMRLHNLRTLAVVACVLSLSAACGSSAATEDISKLLVVKDVKTGWFDAGIERGMNKLVPTLMLTLENKSNEKITQVQLNAVIRRVGEKEEWGGAYTRAIGSEGLAPGASTKPMALRSNLGYTGIEPRNAMMKNSKFVDARIQLFAKYGGANWVKLGEYPVARELLTQ